MNDTNRRSSAPRATPATSNFYRWGKALGTALELLIIYTPRYLAAAWFYPTRWTYQRKDHPPR